MKNNSILKLDDVSNLSEMSKSMDAIVESPMSDEWLTDDDNTHLYLLFGRWPMIAPLWRDIIEKKCIQFGKSSPVRAELDELDIQLDHEKTSNWIG